MHRPRLRIVSVNDIYSLENLPRLCTLVRHHAATNPADAFIVVVAGDFVGPSMLSSLDSGRGMVECLNAAGVTHVIFGNHEDDIPTEDLHKRIQEFRGTWLSTNVRGFDPALVVHQVLKVAPAGGRSVDVGLLGAVVLDETTYRRTPFEGGALEAANPSLLREAELLRAQHPGIPVIPITHQPMEADRDLARVAKAHGIPLVLGGHDHTTHLEQVEGTWIVKVASDAVEAAILDVEWPAEAPPAGADDVPTITVNLEPIATYAEDATVRALVDSHMARLRELETAVLILLPPDQVLSSVGTRFRQTSMGSLVCSRTRDALKAEGCLINGGGIRGAREYRDHLAYAHVKGELPFNNEMAVVRMPGRVVRDAIAFSRSRTASEHGGFLQVDDGMTVKGANHQLTHIAGKPLDPDREYRIAIIHYLLTGLDAIEPLLRFVEEFPEKMPPAGSGRELKELMVDALTLPIWKETGSFDSIDMDYLDFAVQSGIANAIAHAAALTAPGVVNLHHDLVDHAASSDG